MKSYSIKIYKVILSLLVFLYIPVSIISQEYKGNLFIHSFDTENHPGNYQFLSGIQDKRGMMYFGCNSNLLEFDGVEWRIIPVLEKDENIRSLAIDVDGTIYVGSIGEFGYLVPTDNGDLKYRSLLNYVDSVDRDFYSIWSIKTTPEGVYFYAIKKLFRWNGKQMKKWDINGRGFLQYADSNIYLYEKNIGLRKLINDTFKVVSNIDNTPAGLLMCIPYKNNTLLAFRNEKLVAYDINNFTIDKNIGSSINVDKLFYDNFYGGNLLPNNNFAFNTQENGIILTDYDLNFIKQIDKVSGLSENFVWFNYLDNQNGLWVGTNNGINRVDLYSPFTYYDKNNGVDGNILSVIESNNITYISSDVGMFYLKDGQFYRVSNIIGQVWELNEIQVPNKKIKTNNDKLLLVGTQDGVFMVDKDIGKLINPFIHVERIIQSKINPDLVYVGHYNGLSILKISGQKIEINKHVSSIDYQVANIVEDNNGIIWLDAGVHGFIKLRITAEDTIVNKYNVNKGIPTSTSQKIILFDNQIIIQTKNGIYSYDKSFDKFYLDKKLNEHFKIGSVYESIEFIDDSDPNQIYAFANELHSKHEKYVIIKRDQNNHISFDEHTFGPFHGQINGSLFYNHDSITWLFSNKKLIRHDSKTERIPEESKVLIRKVIVNSNRTIFNGTFYKQINNILALTTEQPLKFIPVLEYKDNSLIFHYSSASFNFMHKNKYSFLLKGYNNNWSNWSDENKAVYTNLKEGSYTFYVKTINAHNIESKPAIYEFKIKAPYYRSIVAYITYLIVLSLFIYAIVKLNARRLINEKLQLEVIIKERTKEIVEKNKSLALQAEEILKQNEELNQQHEEITAQRDAIEDINSELRKLSIVASETDNAIMILSPTGKIEWVNNGFTKLYGFTLNELKEEISGNYIDLKTFSDKEKIFYECVNNKNSINYESCFKSKSGKKIWSQSTITPVLDNNGDVYKIIVIDTDLSNIKELENYKTLMTQMIVHDLKTPLNAIIGFSSINKENRHSQIINANGYRMLQLIENILDVHKYKSKGVDLTVKKRVINETINDAYETIEPMLKHGKKITIKLINTIPENTVLAFDYDKIKRVIVNLLTNAIKYAPKNGEIKIISDLTKDKYNNTVTTISVHNNGKSIPKQYHEKIFDEYWQIDQAKFGKSRSTGLGLTFCRMVVEAHGGKIWVESEPNDGATFIFTIPIM